jgi:hypothetical protein
VVGLHNPRDHESILQVIDFVPCLSVGSRRRAGTAMEAYNGRGALLLGNLIEGVVADTGQPGLVSRNHHRRAPLGARDQHAALQSPAAGSAIVRGIRGR